MLSSAINMDNISSSVRPQQFDERRHTLNVGAVTSSVLCYLTSFYESSEVLPALCGRCKKVPDELLGAIQTCKRDDQSVIGILVQIQTVHQSGGSACYQHQKKIGVVRDISPLICPSAQVLRIYGAKHLKHLMQSVNEG